MHITITGRKVNLKNNFKELVEKKLSRYDRIFEENADAHVVVTVEHNRQTVEITIRQSGLIFRAEATDFEMNDALDQVISALGRQIRKNKTKLEKKLHSGALRDYVEDYYNGEVPEQPTVEYKIARTKKVPVKPMHIEEAIWICWVTNFICSVTPKQKKLLWFISVITADTAYWNRMKMMNK